MCQDTQLCHCVRIHNCVLVFFLLFKHVSFFSFFNAFSFTFYFPSLKFSRCLPQNITSRYTIVWFVWRVHYCVQLLSWGHDFLIFSIISFTFSFAKVFSFNYLITFLVSFIWNSQKCPVFQNIWCLIKTQLKNITQTIFQGGSPWATLIHNSVVCLEGTLLCPAAFLRSWFFGFFSIISFTFSFAKVFSFNYLITFLVSFIWNSQKCPVFQNIWCLIKTQLKPSLKQFFKGVVHEQPWYIIVWFVWRVHYCVQLLSWGHDFLFFFNHFLYLFLC